MIIKVDREAILLKINKTKHVKKRREISVQQRARVRVNFLKFVKVV